MDCNFHLASRLSPLLALMKQMAMLGRPTWQRTKGSLLPVTSKKRAACKKRGPANNIGAWAPILPQLSLQLRPQPWLTLCFVLSLETLPQKTAKQCTNYPQKLRE